MSDILTASQIKTPGAATSKDDAIREAGQILVDAGAVARLRRRNVRAREVGVDLHGQSSGHSAWHERGEGLDHVSALSVVRYDQPIDWDGNEIRFAVGIAGYEGGHLEILGKVAVIFSDIDEVDKMVAAGSARGGLRPAQRGERGMTWLAPQFISVPGTSAAASSG